MAENFSDTQKIKQKRKNFMGNVKEIKEIPKLTPKKPIVINNPIETAVEKMMEDTTPTAPAVEPTVVEPDDQLRITKGFIAGYTEDGKVLFKPFGKTSRLEIVALVEYAKAVSTDLLSELAKTKINDIPMIKDVMEAVLKGTKALLIDKSTETKT